MSDKATRTVRRVVTGHDAQGKAIVVADGPAPMRHVNPNNPERVSTDIWRTTETPARIMAEPGETTLGPRRQLPDKGGTVIRINHFPPETASVRTMTQDDAKRAFAALGNEAASTYKPGGRHPMMHRTESIDYAIILFGEMTMLLDDTEVVLRGGDVLVQCGTNHAWSNRSNAPAAIAFILVDGEFDPALAESLARFSAA
ncbi:MAG: cupin domain-containing protein [Hyphomicrobiales bacterium]|nr:cupin domain-containing protein [Alphaproteobacteria bacterium]